MTELEDQKNDESWEWVTPVPWADSNLPDLELVSEEPYIEPGGDKWFRQVLRKRRCGVR